MEKQKGIRGGSSLNFWNKIFLVLVLGLVSLSCAWKIETVYVDDPSVPVDTFFDPKFHDDKSDSKAVESIQSSSPIIAIPPSQLEFTTVGENQSPQESSFASPSIFETGSVQEFHEVVSPNEATREPFKFKGSSSPQGRIVNSLKNDVHILPPTKFKPLPESVVDITNRLPVSSSRDIPSITDTKDGDTEEGSQPPPSVIYAPDGWAPNALTFVDSTYTKPISSSPVVKWPGEDEESAKNIGDITPQMYDYVEPAISASTSTQPLLRGPHIQHHIPPPPSSISSASPSASSSVTHQYHYYSNPLPTPTVPTKGFHFHISHSPMLHSIGNYLSSFSLFKNLPRISFSSGAGIQSHPPPKQEAKLEPLPKPELHYYTGSSEPSSGISSSGYDFRDNDVSYQSPGQSQSQSLEYGGGDESYYSGEQAHTSVQYGPPQPQYGPPKGQFSSRPNHISTGYNSEPLLTPYSQGPVDYPSMGYYSAPQPTPSTQYGHGTRNNHPLIISQLGPPPPGVVADPWKSYAGQSSYSAGSLASLYSSGGGGEVLDSFQDVGEDVPLSSSYGVGSGGRVAPKPTGRGRPLKSYYASAEQFNAILNDGHTSTDSSKYGPVFGGMFSYRPSSPRMPYGSLKSPGSISDEFLMVSQNSYGTPNDPKKPTTLGYYRTPMGSWTRVPYMKDTPSYKYKYRTTMQIPNMELDPLLLDLPDDDQDDIGYFDCENKRDCGMSNEFYGMVDNVDITKRPRAHMLAKLMRNAMGKERRRRPGRPRPHKGRRHRKNRRNRCRRKTCRNKY